MTVIVEIPLIVVPKGLVTLGQVHAVPVPTAYVALVRLYVSESPVLMLSIVIVCQPALGASPSTRKYTSFDVFQLRLDILNGPKVLGVIAPYNMVYP